MSTEHRHWTWAEDCLRDEEGTVWATVRADVLNVNESQLAAAQERILLEHSIDSGSRHFWVRGTATTGETLHVGQQGVSISHMQAKCMGREYTLDRPNPFRRERRIYDASGKEIIRTRPTFKGVLEITDMRPQQVPDVDAAFLTYCCALVDAPKRRRI